MQVPRPSFVVYRHHSLTKVYGQWNFLPRYPLPYGIAGEVCVADLVSVAVVVWLSHIPHNRCEYIFGVGYTRLHTIKPLPLGCFHVNQLMAERITIEYIMHGSASSWCVGRLVKDDCCLLWRASVR